MKRKIEIRDNSGSILASSTITPKVEGDLCNEITRLIRQLRSSGFLGVPFDCQIIVR